MEMVGELKTINLEGAVVGKHVYANLYGVDRALLSNEEYLVGVVRTAAGLSNMTLIDLKSWSFGGRKGGISVIALVVESHIALHTWIEYGYATLDIYTCGANSDPWKGFKYVLNSMKPKRYIVGYADRSMNMPD